MDANAKYRKNSLSSAIASVTRALCLTSTGLLGLHASFALAQTDTPVPAAQDSALPTVTVTAQRREESAQDVGVAVSVLSGEELQKRGITNVNQLQHSTPSLEVEPAFGGGQPQFRIRGVGFQDYASNNTPTVGIYVDEVAFPIPIATQGQLFDLDRVEILRGPQGTLYGRNTTAGAVNFITAKPTKDFTTGINLSYGSNNAAVSEGYVSGPLTDTLQGRLSFANQSGGAWQKNRETGQDFADADQSSLRGQLQWQPNDRTDLRLVVNSGYDKTPSQGLYLFNSVTNAGVTTPADSGRDKTGWGLRPEFAAAIGKSPNAKPGRDNTNQSVALHADIDFDNFRFSSISSYNKFNRRELSDWDTTSQHVSDEYFHTDTKVLSQELRLSSNTPGPLEWVTGVYYSKENIKENFYSDFADVFGFYADTSYKQEAKSLGFFGQAGYHLTDDLKLIVGLRQEHETRDLTGFHTQTYPVNIGFNAQDRSTSMNEVSGKLGLEYQLNPEVLLYGDISRGVKSGGFSAFNSTSPRQIDPFKPEKLLAYELGFKSDLSKTLRLNGSVFYYDYRDQQVLSAVWDPSFGPIGRIVNAPKSNIYGSELELEWQPVSGLRITQALGYKKGEYEKFSTLDVAASTAANREVLTDKKGDDLNFPKLSYGGSVSYGWNVGGFELTAQTDYSYRDTYNSWLGKKYNIDKYWLTNARLDLTQKGAPWTVGIFGHNIFDRNYDQTRNFFVNADVAQAGQPATYGVQLSYVY